MSKEVYGWLAPSGSFYETGMWSHFDAIGEHPELRALVSDDLEAIEDFRQSCEQLIEEGEHPEWHRYEMACDEIRPRVIATLYEAGCLRVGTAGDRLYFEGRPSAIQGLGQKARDLAEGHGMTAEFERKE